MAKTSRPAGNHGCGRAGRYYTKGRGAGYPRARSDPSPGRPRAVLRHQGLEPRVLADWVPARIEPQHVDVEIGWPRQQPLDLVDRRVGVADLGEDQGAIFCQEPAY